MPAIAIPIAITSDYRVVDSSFNRDRHRAAQSSTPLSIFTLPYSASRPAATPTMAITPTYRDEMTATRRPEMGLGGLSLKLNGSVNGEAGQSDRDMSGKSVNLQILYGRFHTSAACRSGGKG